MKAIFIHRDTLLRDSGADAPVQADAVPLGGQTEGSTRLTPATLEAVRNLGADDRLVFLYGCFGAPADRPTQEQGLRDLVRQVDAAGGRIDGLVYCTHGETCASVDRPERLLWAAASQFGLHLNTCYLLGDTAADVDAAYTVGARPIIALGGRTIGEVLGILPTHKDFPMAVDLGAAVDYITLEEEIVRQLGHPRVDATPPQPDDVLYAGPEALPTITVTSSLGLGVQARMRASRTQLRDIARWLSFLVVGSLGVSLGIAYMLTHLYRVQPFPEFMYYLTLQFISRPLRGALFLAMGAAVIVMAARSFRGTSVWGRRPRR